MLQYEQIKFYNIIRQNYRQKRPNTLVITRYSVFLSLSYILYENTTNYTEMSYLVDNESKCLLTDEEKDSFIVTLNPNLTVLRTKAEIITRKQLIYSMNK